MRMTISRSKAWTVLAVGAFVAPTVVSAQDSTSQQPQPATPAQVTAQSPAAGRTHLVRTGDTLWDLSRTYLGDPFLWPEIYRLNTDVVEDPHWIYPGEQLRIPAGSGDMSVVATGETGGGGGGEGESARFGPTMFSQRWGRAQQSTGRLSLIGRTEAPLNRAGEYYAAPWVDRDGGPGGAGRLVASADLTVAQQSNRDRLQVGDRVLLTPPAGEHAERGSRYLAFELGPDLPGKGQVVLPTGVIIVEEQSPRDGEALHARVLSAYDNVRIGQGLIRMDSVTLPTTRPEPVDLGALDAKVIWLRGDNVLPSLHQYIVLDRSMHDGVKQGDQFTLMKRAHKSDAGVKIPNEPIATVQVVRVTAYGSTAMIIDQQQPAIREGNDAKLSAKMP
jgi:LysM repeat protein